MNSFTQAPAKPPAEQTSEPIVRAAELADRQALHELVKDAGVFSAEEVAIAVELIDSALDKPADEDGYRLLIAKFPEETRAAGYICYGRTPFTHSSWDLYWLATHPSQRRRGVARKLCQRLEEMIAKRGGTHIRVETSSTGGYSAARGFYASAGYTQMACIPDFYKPGDDLFTFCKRL